MVSSEVKHKRQEGGSDSWEISEYKDEVLTTKYMVYEEPNKKIDLIKIMSEATKEEIEFIKSVLK